MIISPDRKDFSSIFNVLGRLILGLSLFMFLPAITASLTGEIAPLFDFLVGISICVICGISFIIFFPQRKELTWMHAFFVVSLGWILFSLLGAIPLYLSGHFSSFLDAWFEAMSGFTTTGLTLINDLNHLSLAHNMWRHLIMFIGGQGIILASLSILTKARSVALGFYIGEARQEKILPNVVATARFIWKVSFFYLLLGVGLLFSILFFIKKISFTRSFLDALWIFFAAFDTGGFAPYASNIAYYHSSLFEIATVVLMLLGAINFNLHFWLWRKNKFEMVKNFEIRVFLATFFIILLWVYFSLRGLESGLIFKKGFYQVISAHTGCGFTNQIGNLTKFPYLYLCGIIFAMMIGGGTCSTTGGIKLMRLGIIFKTIIAEVRRWMLPPKAVHKEGFHHLQNLILSEKRIKDSFIIFTLFLFTYFLGAILGIAYGFSPLASLFESVSATANVGLSAGITSASMPVALKLTYIFQMWIGRLEFLSIFVSLGFIFSLLKK